MYTYLLINILTILIPFCLSFESKITFYKKWRALLPAIIISAALFIGWDIYFTAKGVWGFNPAYLIGIEFYHLPLEEILFFFCVPYACLFIYELVCHFQKRKVFGEGSQAQKVFQMILDRNPDIYPARWGLAEALRAQHKLVESKAILKDFIKDYPDFAPAYISLAYIYYIETDFSRSAKLTAEVIRADPSSVDLPNQIRAHGLYAAAKGMLAEYGGPLTKSIDFFAVKKHLAIAQKLDPQSPVVLFGYGTYYMIIPAVVEGLPIHLPRGPLDL